MMDIPPPYRLAMKNFLVQVTDISRLIDFALYPVMVQWVCLIS